MVLWKHNSRLKVGAKFGGMVFAPVHPNEQDFFDKALELVKSAGRLVRDAFDQPASVVHTKASNTDLVTETDQAVEKHLIDGLRAAFPDHRFIGEESVAGGAKIVWDDAPTWIIDPIDGTTNFVHRIPLIGICVGLAINKKLRGGIVYNPITRELYTAQAGKGAFKNGFPIHVSNTTDVSKSLIAISLGIHNVKLLGPSWSDINFGNQRTLIDAGFRGNRAFGSAAINMVMVAQGSVDGYVEYGVHAWDVAAPAIIVQEAGGIVVNPDGSEFNVMGRCVLTTSTKQLAKTLSEKFTHVKFENEA